MWFTEFNAGKIGRITPSGVITEFSTGLTPGSGPFGITNGPDGNLWFAEQSGGGIGRITTSGTITEFTGVTTGGLTTGAAPRMITTGPDGNIWMTQNGVANNIAKFVL